MQSALYLLAAAGAVSAHTRFTELDSSTTKNAVGFGVRVTPNDSPVTDVTSNDIACNVAGVTSSTEVIPVVAGTSVTATWTHGSDVIADSHKGPVMAYLKKVTDATTDTGVGDGWFKISEDAYDVSTEKWGVDNLIASAGLQTIPIPTCLEDGQYLVRTELIALHSASTANGAQFYGGCGQISVTGGTTAKTPSTVSFPGAYSATDPGILIGIYYPKLTNYTAPGPSVFTCDGSSTSSSGSTSGSTSGSSSGSSSKVSSAAKSSTPTTMVTSVKSSSAPEATKDAEVKATADDTSDTSDSYDTTASTTSKPASEATATPSTSSSTPATTGSSETVTEMPEGTTLKTLLKWMSDMIATMLA